MLEVRLKKKNIPRMKNGPMKSGRILATITPKITPRYEGAVCWHGCDKVSRIGPAGLSGGGGS